ncbi:hypothetical protein KI387_035404, partial [Taxus chinensis]
CGSWSNLKLRHQWGRSVNCIRRFLLYEDDIHILSEFGVKSFLVMEDFLNTNLGITSQ